MAEVMFRSQMTRTRLEILTSVEIQRGWEWLLRSEGVSLMSRRAVIHESLPGNPRNFNLISEWNQILFVIIVIVGVEKGGSFKRFSQGYEGSI